MKLITAVLFMVLSVGLSDSAWTEDGMSISLGPTVQKLDVYTPLDGAFEGAAGEAHTFAGLGGQGLVSVSALRFQGQAEVSVPTHMSHYWNDPVIGGGSLNTTSLSGYRISTEMSIAYIFAHSWYVGVGIAKDSISQREGWEYPDEDGYDAQKYSVDTKIMQHFVMIGVDRRIGRRLRIGASVRQAIVHREYDQQQDPITNRHYTANGKGTGRSIRTWTEVLVTPRVGIELCRTYTKSSVPPSTGIFTREQITASSVGLRVVYHY